MFLVTAKKEGVYYQIPVSAVTTDKNTVTLTFADQYKNGLENLTTYTVAITGSKTVSGITYDLSDTNGGKIDVTDTTFNTGDVSESDANKAVTEAIEALKKETVTE